MNMMRLVVLGVAILTAGIAAILAKGLVTNAPTVEAAAPAPEFKTNKVLVMTQEVPVGEKIQAGDLTWQTWPDELVASYFIPQSRDPNALEKLVGSVVRSTLYKGEPVSLSKIIDPEARGFMAAMLKPGMRAVSIEISAETGAGGFILPNDKVDVILTRRVENEDGNSREETFRSDTVLRNVKVLAIDQVFREVEEKQVVVGKTATLELPQRHAEILALAQAMGDVSLSLRGWTGVEEDYNADPEIVTNIAGPGGNADSKAVHVLRYGKSQIVLPRTNDQ